MASGPSDPPRRPPGDDDPRPERAADPHAANEPRIQHSPPGPSDDRARGLPAASPWGMPPFSSPVPGDEPPDPPKGRRPYSSPTAEPETEPRRRRVVNHPDKLVAGGPPRTEPEPRTEDEPADVTPRSWFETEDQPQDEDRPQHEPQYSTPEDSEEDDPEDLDEPEVRRVGRPPAGRPTRPDRLVASGPSRPGGSSGRHHRGPAPSAVRRSSPVRRRSLAAPTAIILALVLLVAGGVLVWQWRSSDKPGLALSEGTERSGDELFTVPSAGDGSDQKLNDMTSVGRAVVAVGSDTTSPTPRPLFLFSPDSGKTWQLGQVNGSTTATVQRVVGGDGRWLASGGDGVGAERGLWTSTDGFTWAAVEQSGLSAFRNGDLISGIARTSSGFVAVGRTTLTGGATGPAAWQSPDGRAWERVNMGGLDVRELKAVVAKGNTVVAIAESAPGEGSRVVRSSDGGATYQATGFQLPEARTGSSLAVLPKQFVLVPTRQRTITGDVRVYCSPTGAQWAQCGSIRGLSGTSPGIESLISYPSGIAAVSQADLGKYSILTSADGRGWAKRTDLGNLPGATLRGFTISDSGTLFAGGDQATADVENQLVLMTAPPRGDATRVRLAGVDGLSRIARQTNRLAGFDGRYVAVGSASGDAGIWTSLNWQSWTSMSLGGTNQQTLDDVAHGRRGWLAVGSTQTDTSVTDPLLVSSEDGRTWKKVTASGDLARTQDHPYLALHVVAAGESGYVLAGEDRNAAGIPNAALWFTPDLRKFTRSKKLPQGGSGVRVYDVAATQSGYVAIGGSGSGDRESAVVWFSEDGVNWKSRDRVSPPEAGSAGLREVVAYQDKLIAIGTAQTSGSRRAFAAVSEDDGTTWRTAWLPADQAAAVYDLAAADQGLVAVGWHGTPGEGDSAVWLSEDGLTWNRVDLTKGRLAGAGMQWLAAVTVMGSEVVALGRSTTYNADHMILWTSSLSSDR
ncbi:hypothetical protein ACQP2T_08970 [Nonomuraea sp. CA-143628]|uniref:hypothetical protein n=1 Tax=Nonomuraea sp. CA-143628 TaxID=3239997 RepID=UPI003D926801